MSDNRTQIKYIRDGVKNNYVYDTKCAICNSSKNLELHHLYTLFYLLQNFQCDQSLSKEEFRKLFIEKYYKELVEDTVTLCEDHHTRLHKIYGKTPLLSTANKQLSWIKKQHDKIFNPQANPSGLSKFKV